MHFVIVFTFTTNIFEKAYLLSQFACPGCPDLNKPFVNRKYAASYIVQYSVFFFLSFFFSFLPYVLCSPLAYNIFIYLFFLPKVLICDPLSVCHDDYY